MHRSFAWQRIKPEHFYSTTQSCVLHSLFFIPFLRVVWKEGSKMAKKTPRSDGYIELKKTITYLDGSRKRMSFYGKTVKAANAAYQKYLMNLDRFEVEKELFPAIPLFSEVADTWLAIKEKSVQDKTWRGYLGHIKQLNEVFGDKPINAITSSELQFYLASRSYESINTVKKRYIYLKGIFELALNDGILTLNPMHSVTMPKCKPAKKPHAYTKEQTRLITEVAKRNGIEGLSVFIPLKTGMRPGEVVAFKPTRDLNLKNMTVSVRETVKLVNGHQVVGPPKHDSYRIVPVDQEFCEHIAKFNFKGYVFSSPKNPKMPMTFSKWMQFRFDKFMAKLPDELPKYTPHEFRHTYGTLLYESGTDLYTIAKVMGHKDVKVTQIYVHQRLDALKEKIFLDF